MIQETFFGSISLYHTASENLLRAILVRTKLWGLIENPLQSAVKVFCTNELFVPRVFSDASHDSLASHARRTAKKVCVGG